MSYIPLNAEKGRYKNEKHTEVLQQSFDSLRCKCKLNSAIFNS